MAYRAGLTVFNLGELQTPVQYRHEQVGGGEIPKFDTGTQAILKFDTSTHHYLKIDTRHATEETHDTCLFYLRQTTRHPSDTKIDNVVYRFFPASETLGSILNVFIPPRFPQVTTAETFAVGECQVV